MRIRSAGWWALAVVLAGAGCSKRESPPGNAPQAAPKPAAPPAPPPPAPPAAVPLVDAGERSRHFEAVARHLELGGPLYGFVDVDGDALKLAAALPDLSDERDDIRAWIASFPGLDYAQLVTDLGLNDIKAVGFSSVPAASGGFRNCTFVYTPDGRHGLPAGVGGGPAPFRDAKMAPVDADFYWECEMDLPAVYAAIKTIVRHLQGDIAAEGMDAWLKKAGDSEGFSALQVIQSFKGRTSVVLWLDPEKRVVLPTPQPVTVPAFSFVIRIDGIGPALERALAKAPTLDHSKEGTVQVHSVRDPTGIPGMRPVLAVEGAAILVASSREFLFSCLRREAGLDQNPDFRKALDAVGPEGNGLSYISPRFFAELRRLKGINPSAKPELRRYLKMLNERAPTTTAPSISVRTNLPDGILVRSHGPWSLKHDLAMAAVGNPVALGVLAGAVAPAYRMVRETAEEEAVIGNLRLLYAAADQYCAEHGVESATYDDLVGSGKPVQSIQSVAGEDYRSLEFNRRAPLRIRMRNGRIIQFPRR